MSKAARAFIFDMDGTIVDNMAFHTRSWLEFFARRGMVYEAEAFFRETAGAQGKRDPARAPRRGRERRRIAALALEKDMLYREMYGPHRRAIEGFEHLVTGARGTASLAVATSAPPLNIVFTLDELDLRRHFDAVVGAADVARGKPHPDVFLKAAEQLRRRNPADCIVFEDAPMGVEAARRAGMRAVVITTTLPAEAFAEFDNVIASSRTTPNCRPTTCAPAPEHLQNRPETTP
jgi:HAD superfamily hydrolase (TIGR01509 family)